MSENGRVFILQGHAFQWTGIRMQKIRVTRKIKEFKVRRVPFDLNAVVSSLMPCFLDYHRHCRCPLQDIRPVATLPVQPMTEALKTSFRRKLLYGTTVANLRLRD